jgi:Glycosyltransferase family 87
VRHRLLRDGFLVLAIVFVALRLLSIEPWDDSVDAFAYWSTRDGVMYGGPIGTGGAGVIGAYLYSPAFAQVLAPAVRLPWPVFAALWTALNFAVLWWLARRAAVPALVLVLLPPVAFEIISGNVHLLYAAAIVAGFRFAGTWALMLLTKLTPGIGLLWFAVRREWRPLAVALGFTAVLAAASYLLDPGAWRTWADLIVRDLGAPLVTTGWYLPVPLVPRLVAAGLVVAWGALTDRAWTIPIAVTLALPILWLNGLSVLVACLPLAREGAWRGSDFRGGQAAFVRFASGPASPGSIDG